MTPAIDDPKVSKPNSMGFRTSPPGLLATFVRAGGELGGAPLAPCPAAVPRGQLLRQRRGLRRSRCFTRTVRIGTREMQRIPSRLAI